MKLALIVGALAVPVLIAGCKDHSGDIRALQGEVASARADAEDARRALDGRLKAAEQQIKTLEDLLGQRDDGRDKLARDLDDVRQSLVEVRAAKPADAVVIEKRLGDIEKRVEQIKDEAVNGAVAKVATMPVPGVLDEKQVAAIVDKKLREQAEAAKPTKNLADALKRLDISEAERRLIRDQIKESKKQMLELLETPTTTGRIPAEEVIDTIIRAGAKEPGSQERFKKLITDLSEEKVPGDAQGRTYLTAVADIKNANKQSIMRVLSEGDQRKLEAAHGDWTEFEIGEDDPWGPLYAERLALYQKEKG